MRAANGSVHQEEQGTQAPAIWCVLLEATRGHAQENRQTPSFHGGTVNSAPDPKSASTDYRYIENRQTPSFHGGTVNSAPDPKSAPTDDRYMVSAVSRLGREGGTEKRDGNGGAIRYPTPFHCDVPSVQPILDLQAWHSFEIGSVGGQEKCVVDQRRRRDFQIP